MIRVVFDTNALFSATFKEVGVPVQLLDLVTFGLLTPCVADAVTGNLRHFPKHYEPTAIVTPRDLLKRLIIQFG